MTEPLFPVFEHDRRFYTDTIAKRLPPRIIDIHTHVWLSEFRAAEKAGPARNVTWPSRVAEHNPVEDLEETYRLLFPGKEVTPVMFSVLDDRADDFAGGNRYVAEASRRRGYPSLLFARPDWSASELEQRLDEGPFRGLKVYLSLSDPSIRNNDITIYDFLPRHHLEVANRRRLLIILHIPRSGRLRDPVNVRQLMELDHAYPEARIVVAHAGRAYCAADLGDALKTLRTSRNLLFDISANTNAEVFTRLIEAVGPGRILFGSDLPITRMRMRRIEEAGRYVNLVPKGLYGDVSGDPNMRDVPAPESDGFTFFLYEEIAAFLAAADRTGLSSADLASVFFGNADHILGGTR